MLLIRFNIIDMEISMEIFKVCRIYSDFEKKFLKNVTILALAS